MERENQSFEPVTDRYLAASTPSLTTSRRHLPVLDGVRGLAIFLILIYHFTLDMTGHGIASRLCFKICSAGWCGVDLFFVLSGFLITGILDDSKDKAHRFRNFYIRRALRIFPLYYGCLGIVFLITSLFPAWSFADASLEHLGYWLAFYGTNVLVSIRGTWFPLSHFWSLAVEEHFYLIWPFVIFLCSRRTSLIVCVISIFLSFLFRIWFVSQGQVLAAYCFTACRMDALAIGGFLALFIRTPGGAQSLVRISRILAAVSLAVLAGIAGWRFGFAFYDPFVQIVGYFFLDLFFAAMLALAIFSSSTTYLVKTLNAGPLRWLGKYSYGLYVYNSIIILIAEHYALQSTLIDWCHSPLAGRLLYVAGAMLGTLLAALLSWHLYEKQFLRFKTRFPNN